MGGSCLVAVAGLAFTGFILWRVMKSIGPNRQILPNGIPAKATIRPIWQTGTFINENPRVGMHLEVQPPSGMPYVAQVNAVVPMINIPEFQPGVVIPVNISRTDPSQVELDVYGPRPRIRSTLSCRRR